MTTLQWVTLTLIAAHALLLSRLGRFSLPHFIAFLSLVPLWVGISGPQWGHEPSVKPVPSNYWLCVDVSPSMLAEDVYPNRLHHASRLATELLQQLKNQNVGLIAFSRIAKVVVPPTRDHVFLRNAVAHLGHTSVSKPGSDFMAPVKHLEHAEQGASGALVIFTDGGQTQPATTMQTKNTRVIFVGIGDSEKQSVLPLARGRSQLRSRLDEEVLRNAARTLGGIYIPARDAQVEWESVLARWTRWESEIGSTVAREQYQWFALIALGLAILGWWKSFAAEN